MAFLHCLCGHPSCPALPSCLQWLDTSAGCAAGGCIAASEGHTDGAQHRHKQLCLSKGCLMRAQAPEGAEKQRIGSVHAEEL